MKRSKDLFSTQSLEYSTYRPVYPQELYSQILAKTINQDSCWDAGTGNGQVAGELANYFEQVHATDISQNQLDHAVRRRNIHYHTCRSESTPFGDHQFDLVTVGQAIHWFDLNEFYNEVSRVVKPNGTIAVWGYGLFRSVPKVDEIVADFYENIVGPYWDPERKYIEEEYSNVNFPFRELEIRKLPDIKNDWDIEHLQGFFNSWSAVQNFIRDNDFNPVEDVIHRIKAVWGRSQSLPVQTPLFMRIGRLPGTP